MNTQPLIVRQAEKVVRDLYRDMVDHDRWLRIIEQRELAMVDHE